MSLPVWAAYRDDIGYTALQAELGAATPTGAAVVVSQVEGSVTVGDQSTWMPDPTVGDFIGKTLTSVTAGAPAGIYSGHATAVGVQFYGSSTALANGVSTINAYDADHWVGSDFLWTSGIRRPAYAVSRVVNHSWVGDAGTSNGEILRRLDWVIEYDDMIHVTGLNNGSGPSTSALLANAYNSIAVGRSEGMTQTGSVAIDATYAAGRTRPDIVAPADNTSLATGRISSAVALLVDAGHADPALSTHPGLTSYTNRAGLLIRNAERVEVIRAALMAGADRVTRNSSSTNLARYRDTAANQSPNGLDYRYGAGQLNVRNSYDIIASGEQNSQEDGGPGSGTAMRGFDYDPAFGGTNGTNSAGTYPLPVSAQPRLLTATLAWNLNINGGSQASFNGTPYSRDLNLLVLDVSTPSSPVTVYASQSTTDNTENAWLVIPAGAQYALQVTSASATSINCPTMTYPTYHCDYAIAWQALPDRDSDGAHDGQDDCINSANGPLLLDAGGNSQRDTDGDGYGNLCDGDIDNSGGLVNFTDLSLFRAAFGTSNANADIDGSGGLVNFTDLALFRAMFGKASGPSAYAP